jgi:hypothetical protein
LAGSCCYTSRVRASTRLTRLLEEFRVARNYS